MIKALIQNGKDRNLLLTFPIGRMKLAGSLVSIGIDKPASEISCMSDEENGITVKLFGDDEIHNKIISAITADKTLAAINTACDLIDNAVCALRFPSQPSYFLRIIVFRLHYLYH